MAKKPQPPKIVRQPPRLLRPAGSGHYTPERDRDGMSDTDDDLGYTVDPHRALRHEPECVPEADQHRITETARANYEALHAEDLRRRADRSVVAEVRELQAEARKRGVDLQEDFRTALERARAKLR